MKFLRNDIFDNLQHRQIVSGLEDEEEVPEIYEGSSCVLIGK